MELTQSPGITETLANLSIAWIFVIVAVLTVIRLGLIRIPNAGARSFAEILESGIIAIVLVFLIIRPFVLQAYYIPSPSMEPTLLGQNNVGDRILVNKFSYRIHPPRRDDVVVFLAPPAAMEDNPDFIKRLIGVPGDVIQASRGRVVIDGQEYDHDFVRNALGHAGVFGTDAESSIEVNQADHHVKFVDDGVLADGKLVPKAQLAEIIAQNPQAKVEVIPGYTMRNGVRLNEPFTAEDPDYDLQIYDGRPLKHQYVTSLMRNVYQLGPLPEQQEQPQTLTEAQYDQDKATKPGAIPPHELLMMGDNRNDSNDGTNWGLLRDKRVVGRAVFIFWPLNRIHPIH